MLQKTTQRFHYLLETIPGLLKNISVTDIEHRHAPGKWSKKEILGHLIDSAANNHQRFIRVPLENEPFIIYDQNGWVANGYYQAEDAAQVIRLWESYNRHLLHIVENIPDIMLARTCLVNDNRSVTLQWLIEDYVVHMEHHLKQILQY